MILILYLYFFSIYTLSYVNNEDSFSITFLLFLLVYYAVNVSNKMLKTGDSSYLCLYFKWTTLKISISSTIFAIALFLVYSFIRLRIFLLFLVF